MRPAREVLRLPRLRKVVVEEKTRAAAEPRWPRSQPSNGTRKSRSNNQGWAKESAQGEFEGQNSDRLKCASFHKPIRFLQQQTAILPGGVVTSELNQIAAVQEIAQERLLVAGEW